jgi:hypothetical protein
VPELRHHEKPTCFNPNSCTRENTRHLRQMQLLAPAHLMLVTRSRDCVVASHSPRLFWKKAACASLPPYCSSTPPSQRNHHKSHKSGWGTCRPVLAGGVGPYQSVMQRDADMAALITFNSCNSHTANASQHSFSWPRLASSVVSQTSQTSQSAPARTIYILRQARLFLRPCLTHRMMPRDATQGQAIADVVTDEST